MAHFSFDPNDLQQLNRLAFLPRAGSNDASAGSRRSRRGGEGSEFLDYRAYVASDDVRRVDWNVFGHTKQLFIRLNESPRQLGVTFLLDSSRSMGFGAPTKLEHAQKLVCALAFMALRGGDRVHVYGFGDSASESSGALNGSRGLARLVQYLQRFEASGVSRLSDGVDRVRQAKLDRGAVVIVSDFLNVPSRDQAIRSLTASGATVVLVQVLAPIDRGEGLSGTLRLRDSESGRMVDVDIDPARLRAFQRKFEADREQFARSHLGVKCHYALAQTSEHYLRAVCDAMPFVGKRR